MGIILKKVARGDIFTLHHPSRGDMFAAMKSTDPRVEAVWVIVRMLADAGYDTIEGAKVLSGATIKVLSQLEHGDEAMNILEVIHRNQSRSLQEYYLKEKEK